MNIWYVQYVALLALFLSGDVMAQPNVVYSTCNGAMNSKCPPVGTITCDQLGKGGCDSLWPAPIVLLSINPDGVIVVGGRKLDDLSADELRALVRQMIGMLVKR